MFEHSVIRKSGQWPKALAAFWTVIAGGVALSIGLAILRTKPGLPLVATGMLLGLAGAIVGAAGIRCPACRTRWVWNEINGERHNQWLMTLLGRSECPRCGYPEAGVPRESA